MGESQVCDDLQLPAPTTQPYRESERENSTKRGRLIQTPRQAWPDGYDKQFQLFIALDVPQFMHFDNACALAQQLFLRCTVSLSSSLHINIFCSMLLSYYNHELAVAAKTSACSPFENCFDESTKR